jgi:hypothetical protein
MASDEFPFTCRTWAERSRTDCELKRKFDLASDSGTHIDSIFFGTRTTRDGSAGVYLELYYEKATRTLSVCCFVFIAGIDTYREERAGSVKQFQFTDQIPPEVQFDSPTALGKAYWFSLVVRLHTDSEELRVLGAQAKLHKNYSATYVFNNLRIPPTSFPSRNQNISMRGKLLSEGQVLCPNCFGHGGFNTMTIPKADWQSGTTGYALYSCNQANGRVACHVCGGSGGEYLSWYLEERPDLVGVTLVPGSGLLPSRET